MTCFPQQKTENEKLQFKIIWNESAFHRHPLAFMFTFEMYLHNAFTSEMSGPEISSSNGQH